MVSASSLVRHRLHVFSSFKFFFSKPLNAPRQACLPLIYSSCAVKLLSAIEAVFRKKLFKPRRSQSQGSCSHFQVRACACALSPQHFKRKLGVRGCAEGTARAPSVFNISYYGQGYVSLFCAVVAQQQQNLLNGRFYLSMPSQVFALGAFMSKYTATLGCFMSSCV